jgi:hypothetical protein
MTAIPPAIIDAIAAGREPELHGKTATICAACGLECGVRTLASRDWSEVGSYGRADTTFEFVSDCCGDSVIEETIYVDG